MRTTYTFALLELSPEAFEEIKSKLETAGYDTFHFLEEDGELRIDMRGIAVIKEK